MGAPKNPPAFPTNPALHGDSGMSLRDYFAGQALSVINVDEALAANRGSGRGPARFIAALAYELADAMLAEREKGGDA